MQTRRRFLQTTLGLGASALGLKTLSAAMATAAQPWFNISLAQWSLHRAFRSGTADARDFARIARQDFGIDAVEYVNQFYRDTLTDALIADLRVRADAEGVRSLLIMCDGEGRLGDPDPAARARTVTNHHRWVAAAKALGCHSIRVNAASEGSYDEQIKLASDGLRALAEYCAGHDLNVIVENHGGLSSNGAWLAGVMRMTDHPRAGTLPDFGNFRVSSSETYDRYLGVAEMMPFARGVSAKSYDFDAEGYETTIDFPRMLGLVRTAGYRGYVGVEYEGNRLPEPEGIRATKILLERLRFASAV